MSLGARSAWICFAALGVVGSHAGADEAPTPAPIHESLQDAWWTGPLLAANASTLPQGHLYFEPYLYDLIPYARFDSSGHARHSARQHDYGSLSYVNYGLADRLTVGLIPRFSYDWIATGGSSNGIEPGDLTLQGQFRLTQFHEGSWIPTLSINLQQTLPTGRFDRLESPGDGSGSGAEATTLSLFSQTYLWMATGRILRVRLNLSYAFSSRVDLEDLSVYGTSRGFRGYARPGTTLDGDLAFEYSITRHWVAALDLWSERDGSTHVVGSYPASSGAPELLAYVSSSGSAQQQIFAPAVEYNWSARLGIIGGARIVVAGRNETATAAPVAAISCFF